MLHVEQLEHRCIPSLTPIPSVDSYQGVQGGLYPGGSNVAPPVLTNVQPLDAEGRPDPNGKIGVLLIGDTFTRSVGEQLIADASISNVVFVNAGQAGQYDYRWAYSPKSSAWIGAAKAVAAAGLTPVQIQVTWTLFEGHRGSFPDDAKEAQEYEEAVLRFTLVDYPNAHLALASPQTHVYPSGNQLFVEPTAYEEGFSIQFTIAAQIAGQDNLNYDPSKGLVVAPQELWGPYIWADGAGYGGFAWSPADVNAYGLTAAGNEAVARALLAFFSYQVPLPLDAPVKGLQAASDGKLLEVAEQGTASGASYCESFTIEHSSWGGAEVAVTPDLAPLREVLGVML